MKDKKFKMPLSKEQWNKSFEKGKDYTPLNEFFIDDLLDYLEEDDGNISSVLDLGCGTGDSLIKFARKEFNCVGVDFSKEALKKARKKVASEGFDSEIDFLELDLNDLNSDYFKDNFDIVFSKLTYTFIKDKKDFLKEVRKIINKNNGKFILITPVTFSDFSYSNFIENISVPYEETLSDLEDVFNEVEIFHKNYFKEKGVKITFILS